MKLRDMYENVVDFPTARAKRDSKSSGFEVEFNSAQLRKTNPDHESEVDMIADWFQQYKAAFKMPKFNGLDEVFSYLTTILQMPSSSERIQSWYTSLPQNDKDNVMMIVHHGKRIAKELAHVREVLQKYDHHAHTSEQASDTLSYMYSELQMDEGIIVLLMSHLLRDATHNT